MTAWRRVFSGLGEGAESDVCDWLVDVRVQEMETTSLRRKLVSVEDQLAARADADDVFAKNRKLTSLIDKYHAELDEAHREIRQLKSLLVDNADAKVRHLLTLV